MGTRRGVSSTSPPSRATITSTAPSATKPSQTVTNTRTGTTVTVPIGQTALLAPSFYDEHDVHANGDINIWSKHQIRLRYLYNRQRSPNVSESPLAQFTGNQFFDVNRATATDAWTINSGWVSDIRLGYTRQLNRFAVPGQFAHFPHVFVNRLRDFFIG